jgi:hypothetical protein
LCAWEMVRPTTGPFPQISHRFAMMSSGTFRTDAPDPAGRKLQIVFDGQGMINEPLSAGGGGWVAALLR